MKEAVVVFTFMLAVVFGIFGCRVNQNPAGKAQLDPTSQSAQKMKSLDWGKPSGKAVVPKPKEVLPSTSQSARKIKRWILEERFDEVEALISRLKKRFITI